MNDNKPTLLVYDREQYLTTGVTTWVTSDKQMSFTFSGHKEQESFINAFYRNRMAAMFAYLHMDRYRNFS